MGVQLTVTCPVFGSCTSMEEVLTAAMLPVAPGCVGAGELAAALADCVLELLLPQAAAVVPTAARRMRRPHGRPRLSRLAILRFRSVLKLPRFIRSPVFDKVFNVRAFEVS